MSTTTAPAAFRFMVLRIDDMPPWLRDRDPTLYIRGNRMEVRRGPDPADRQKISAWFGDWLVMDSLGNIHAVEDDVFEAIRDAAAA